MIRVVDLDVSSLPEKFLAELPKSCDICGSPTEITETLSSLVCPNPVCLEKSVHRLVAMLKDLGVKNMGESKCRAFLETFGITNPYAIFMYETSDGVIYNGASEDFSEAMFDAIDDKREMLLWEFIHIGNMPKIRDSARKLLADYDDLESFYEDLEDGGIAFVQDKLGIGQSSDSYDILSSDDEVLSVRAVSIYETLTFHKEDLLEAVDFVNIKKLDTPMINICISTSVGFPFSSKSDFVSQMNKNFGDKVHLNLLSSVTKECEFLIWSKEGTPTGKVNKAYKINDKRELDGEEPIQVMTGSEFESYLNSL